MNILKKLKFLFQCETAEELSKQIGLSARLIRDYRRTARTIPSHVVALLNKIYEQQQRIQKLENKYETDNDPE